ncbi:MAG: 3-deoxy-D-manno-octulosonic acid transferase [Prevotellaceae bacterium]|nr:3-deoxy-D-manno-octulosonic acid transferase [Prevotellaceae bacterium]
MYSLAIYLYALGAKLFALRNRKARLLVRGQRETWKILRERIDSRSHYIWFHAASLGEFEQGRPLIERLRREQPDKKILLTFFSPSGYEVRKNYECADIVCYLPFDTPGNARRFVRLARIEKAFLIKYEFWCNYIDMLHKKGIPVYSISSIFRTDQIFFRPYGRNYARCLRRITHFFVQNEISARLLNHLGIESTTVAGDTRFDRVLDIMHAARPLPEVERFASDGAVIVAGSTWAPDEDLLIAYFNAHPGLKLILAPHVVSERHVEEIEGKLTRRAVRYSSIGSADIAQADCLIIDCYGLLSSIYRYATAAYVGGGFGAGLHNVPEAAVYGCPVLVGPNNRKFREARALIDCGGCFEIRSQADVDATLDRLLSDPAALRAAGTAAAGYIRANAGATGLIYDRTLRP